MVYGVIKNQRKEYNQLSPGFLNQHNWISQRMAAVAAADSMTFPEEGFSV